ncbi:hypothetical protein FGE12_11170 [Aggregicoccus sp. 17bor-14]|uniref:hypothetical protein n=1 Tax=Myxococcaceae TaxID=31 RepID=UPI00129CE27D|nr:MULTISPECIES: hypothetical protein [Myxococcaceae]MBF5042950.1 hypothetical protein [Simulacricoccus sp. 17bor-14]MRI88716.1 hypothetical protein [Aggregicoccus sp. 17bor-14]
MPHLPPLLAALAPRSPLWLLGVALSSLVALALQAYRARQRRQRTRQVADFGRRLGLSASTDGHGAEGELAGRRVALRFESDPVAGDDECVVQLRVDLREVLGASTELAAWLLPAWVEEARAHASGEPPLHSSARSARLERLPARLRTLLGAPEVLPLLGAFVRTNKRTWLEKGALRASRRWRRGEPALQDFLEQGLALGAALTSAAHAPRPSFPAEAKAG